MQVTETAAERAQRRVGARRKDVREQRLVAIVHERERHWRHRIYTRCKCLQVHRAERQGVDVRKAGQHVFRTDHDRDVLWCEMGEVRQQVHVIF